MSRLREVLEDDSNNPLWIERVPKRGYRFIGATLALLRTFERRWDEADEASRKALALEPENPHVHMVRAQLLSCLGQHEEAIREARLAVDLDPIHLRAHMHLTKALLHARMWEPCVHAGKPQEALELNLQTRRSGNLLAAEVAFNAYIAARAGASNEALSAVASLQQTRRHRYVPAITLCWLELALGHDDSAIEWLLTAQSEGESFLAFMDVDPMYDRLRTRLDSLIADEI